METSAPGVPKGPVPRLVPHKSLAERAYDILEEAIVTLELAPGSYTVVGTRPGYRDVRREINVVPGATLEPVVIRCEEKI